MCMEFYGVPILNPQQYQRTLKWKNFEHLVSNVKMLADENALIIILVFFFIFVVIIGISLWRLYSEAYAQISNSQSSTRQEEIEMEDVQTPNRF